MVTPFFLWFLVWSPIVYQKKEVSFCFLDEFFQCQVNMRYPKKPIKSRIIHKFFTAKVELINKTFGCSRFVFNHFLAKWDNAYKKQEKV